MFLQSRLNKVQESGALRSLSGTVNGTDFWSNDYLGLARTQVQSKLEEAIITPLTSGSTGSRSISGDADAYHAIERMIADYHGFPSATVFNSGYTANVGLLSSLLRRGDVIYYDELMHASCRDGIRLGMGRGYRFVHNDADDLAEGLAKLREKYPDGQLFVLTESRFSMDGDVAPLAALADVCDRFGAHLIVDEAHSTGLDGAGGAGSVAKLGLQERVFALVATYGKAMGCHGAAVLGSAALRDYLINFSRPFIYTTGPAPVQWQGIAEAYRKLAGLHEERYAALAKNISYFREKMNAAGLGTQLLPANGPIQILSVPGNAEVMAAEAACREAGLLVKGIRSPTVGVGLERLRICLHSFNLGGEIDSLVSVLARCVKG